MSSSNPALMQDRFMKDDDDDTGCSGSVSSQLGHQMVSFQMFKLGGKKRGNG